MTGRLLPISHLKLQLLSQLFLQRQLDVLSVLEEALTSRDLMLDLPLLPTSQSKSTPRQSLSVSGHLQLLKRIDPVPSLFTKRSRNRVFLGVNQGRVMLATLRKVEVKVGLPGVEER